MSPPSVASGILRIARIHSLELPSQGEEVKKQGESVQRLAQK
ncbi:hypothetical protein FOXYSP1_19321 [Fusarium oxysporum f. sp. phaseoli]